MTRYTDLLDSPNTNMKIDVLTKQGFDMFLEHCDTIGVGRRGDFSDGGISILVRAAVYNECFDYIQLVFDFLDIPKDMTLKERFSYYYLLERVETNYDD